MGRWLRSREARTLLGVLVVAMGIWAFVGIARAVVAGRAEGIDRAVLRLTRQPGNPAELVGPRWAREVARDVTALGSAIVLLLVVAGVGGSLALMSRRREAALLLVVAFGGWGLSLGLKAAIGRERPELFPAVTETYNSSFPSGHSMVSAAVYLTVGAALARLTERRWLKVHLMGLAVALTGIVGLSRVYLGVHYPTDVVAGWSLGVAWATLCWLVHRFLASRADGSRHPAGGVSHGGGAPRAPTTSSFPSSSSNFRVYFGSLSRRYLSKNAGRHFSTWT